MAELNLQRLDVLYSNRESGVEIYSGYLQPAQLPVAIKELIGMSFPVLNTALQESMGMARLVHPAVVRIYDCSIEAAAEGGLKAVIVTELLESDAEKEIRKRKREQRPWTDQQLMAVLGGLVSALRLAQSLEIAHRDIKPQNLFTSADGCIVKLGDFGSCLSNISNRRADSRIAGSPLYLSPQLKAAHAQSILGPQVQPHTYDLYKADVYSLGATLLAMARLEVPMELMGLEGLMERTERMLMSLGGFGVLTGWLRWMLAVEDRDRPDFVELYKHMRLQGYIREEQTQGIAANVPQYQPPVRPATSAYQHLPMPSTRPSQPQYGLQVNPAVIPAPVPAIRPSQALYGQQAHPAVIPSLPQYPSNQHRAMNAFLTVPSPAQLPVYAVPQYEQCVGCSGCIGGQMIPVVLYCGHKFHNSDCFFVFLERLSKHFVEDITNLPCPLCNTPNDRNYALVKAFGTRGFELKREQAIGMMCCQCGCKAGLMSLCCSHRVCSAHSGHPYCLYCKKTSYVRRP